MRHFRPPIWCCWTLIVTATACAPLTVATTAQPVPQGETAPVLIWYTIPNGIEVMRDSARVAWLGIDAEGRIGVSDRADVGVRIPSGSGIVVTYKYRLSKNADHKASAIAIMGGGGFVNWGNHAHFEATLIASGHQSLLTPYGGLRLAQVVPLSRSARSDSPTAGGFFGLRLGKEELGVSVEVGVFYDRSALGVRSSDVIVVPALVLHGEKLLNALTRATGGRPR
ncbi:MAG: hypothetical protein DMD58_08315 [Gemmatimonadetes bacterium]|nr:MAG: hypothetical protein DMD58_08315 [Gemmatimonadota bacterium]